MKNADSDRSVKGDDGPCHAEYWLVDFNRDHPSLFNCLSISTSMNYW